MKQKSLKNQQRTLLWRYPNIHFGRDQKKCLLIHKKLLTI